MAETSTAETENRKSKPGMERSFTQEQVVNAAFQMIDEAGYGKFSMRALADKLGMGTMSLYTYVPSKKQLLFLVLSKLSAQIDNSPVPGERWDDSLHRTCDSIRQANIAHPNVRVMASLAQLDWPQQHRKSIYRLHMDQGMPKVVYESMYSVLRAFLTGFIDMEVNRILEHVQSADDPDAAGDWARIAATDTEPEKFHQGIDFIIAGTRQLAAPDPCDWRTPEDESAWTWGK